MRAIPFVKASACGNDFLLVDLQHAPAGAELGSLTRQLCERHDGIGADGVEWLSPDPQADVRARLFNNDGSPAEISGNGTRCVAAYLASERALEKVTIRTDAGVKACTLTRHDGPSFEFDIAMGGPEVGDPFAIKLAFGEITGVPVSMGNPHFVIFVDEFVPGWQAEAAEIGKHHDFKHGINVEFVQVRDAANIAVMFFERGVGETRSSGTGSCASAVATIYTGRGASPLTIHTQGGVQTVRWEQPAVDNGGEVFLRGSARLVGRGEYFI